MNTRHYLTIIATSLLLVGGASAYRLSVERGSTIDSATVVDVLSKLPVSEQGGVRLVVLHNHNHYYYQGYASYATRRIDVYENNLGLYEVLLHELGHLACLERVGCANTEQQAELYVDRWLPFVLDGVTA